MSVNEKVNDALKLWTKICGIPDKKKQNKNSLDDYEIERHASELNESRALDPSGVTTFMMLEGLLAEHVVENKFTFDVVLSHPDYVAEKLEPIRALQRVLSDPGVLEIVSGFRATMEDALVYYDVKEKDPATELIKSPYGLSFLRRDAMRSFNKLEAHQFSYGQPSNEPFKYNRQVYEFWNINSLVLAMQGNVLPHVSLILVRDPEVELASYFVFAIANGETLTVLTDREEGPHPAFNRMSRRPDRNLERRAEKHWFPYGLLDLGRTKKMSPTGELFDDRLYVKKREQLVPLDTQGIPLKPISELKAEEFLWLIMVFEQIKIAYGRENKQLSELSYTGEMIVNPHALIGSASALVKQGHYKALELPPVTKETLEVAHKDAQWERAPVRQNQWMVARYGPQVPLEVLSLVGKPEKLLLSAETAKALVTKEDGPLAKRPKEGDLVASNFSLEALSPVNFGPKKKIADDYLWMARVNQMRAIQALAVREHEAKREEIDRWYETAVRARLDFIVDAVAAKTLKLPVSSWDMNPDNPFVVPKEGTIRSKVREALQVGFGPVLSKTEPHISVFSWAVLLGVSLTSRYECALVKDAPAVVFGLIEPRSSESIAALLGLSIEELPWPLQNWFHSEPYTGNSILDRLDPVDWVLRNPWSDHHNPERFNSTVLVCLSKGAFNQRREKLGLLPVKISAQAPPRTWADSFSGKKVRLRRDMETVSGVKFKENEIVEVASTYRKRLVLNSLDGKRSIRAVDTWDVDVVEERQER